MREKLTSGRSLVLALAALVATVSVACSGGQTPDSERTGEGVDAGAGVSPSSVTTPAHAGANGASSASAAHQQAYNAGPTDLSKSIVQRSPTITISKAVGSLALRDLPTTKADEDEDEEKETVHAPLPIPLSPGLLTPLLSPDAVMQASAPIRTMPVALQNFLGQGTTLEGCTFPSPPAGCTTTGDPADTNGAVGPNHFVQTVNGGIGIWNKAGGQVLAPRKNNLIWTGYPTTDGNGCAANNNGDPVVVYDQIADRWMITQFDIHNFINKTGATNYQCVAVSKTADPTGAYWLYDFPYNGLNDYGKFGLWPDAYYATFNLFNSAGTAFVGSDLCAYDRVSMLAGATATQQCFQQSAAIGGVLPVSMDGKVLPPRGEPAYFATFDTNVVDVWKMHVDFAVPANSTLTGPSVLPVAPFTITCPATARQACIPQPGTAQQVSALSDRFMFRLAYRNFGTHESLTVNHAVQAGATSGIRWYEIRTPGGTPTIFQQGTYAPADTNWRWLGSIAMDQAEDFAMGFSVSNATTLKPSIAWTGRLNSDAVNTMGQGESIIDVGAGVETGANRWGDYANMTVDPVDDCTFWYTSQLFNTTGTFTWDTNIASVKFPSCGANNFSIAVAPATQALQQNKTVTYTVTTAVTAGAAESIALVIQDLPTGVTGAFVPATVTAGGSSTLTLSAAVAAPIVGNTTFTVIGKATSAVHAATAAVSVIACAPGTTCPAGDNCGTVPNGCGGTISCGPACTAPQTCGGGGTPNVCGCTPITTCPAGDNCGTISNGCGGTVTCGPACTAPQTCGGGGAPNVCGCTPLTTCPAGKNCGTIPNNCGGTVSCGPACAAPQSCGGGGNPNVCGCTPITACPAGLNCGTISNGCGGTISCGPACTAPQSCGGGGSPNVCGCTPLTVCPGGQNCGTAPNGCGGQLTCGTCTAPQTCGGGGTTGVCGCTPITTCPAGSNCGTISNGCGGTVTCGPACTAPQSCGGGGTGNVCGCTTNTVCANGQNCGTAPNGCGGTMNCGTCAAPQTCGGGGTPTLCGCTKTTCTAEGAQCGSVADKCGGNLSCGTCSGGNVCNGSNKCVPGPADAGGTDSGNPGDDAGQVTDSGSSGGTDSGNGGKDSGSSGGTSDASADGGGSGGTGDNGGCGCRTVDSKRTPSWAFVGVGGLALLGVLRRRRRSVRRDGDGDR